MTIPVGSMQSLITVVLVLVGGHTNGLETKQCPLYCTCDLFENFNRADCSYQRLIAANVEVPSAVEVLDISHNDITTLDNVCFEDLIYLLNLTISNNAVHTIYLEAFSPLKDVKSIDLSYNRLEYFDERIFETNTKLTRLDLSGNKFMTLQNKPFLRSTSMRFLGLQDAQVTYIYPLMFTETPALREIDLSNNLMITLSATPFNSLQQLEVLNLEDNRWICDKTLDNAIQSLKQEGKEINLSKCSFVEYKKSRGKGGPHMFERMMEAPLSETTTTTKKPTSIEEIWKPKKSIEMEMKCETRSTAKVCELYHNCLASKQDNIGTPRGLYTLNDIHFVFFTGISLGVATVMCLVSCWVCIKRCLATQKKISQRRAERAANSFPPHRPIPPLVPLRQHRSNRRYALNPPPLNRSLSSPARRGPSDQSDFATFVSRFFERPARHQYYRTINENAGRMIRRLSQTNLSNRLSQHFSGPRSGNSENVQHMEPLIYSQPGNDRYSSNQPQVHHLAIRISRDEAIPTPVIRPETPPPSYGDAVKI